LLFWNLPDSKRRMKNHGRSCRPGRTNEASTQSNLNYRSSANDYWVCALQINVEIHYIG
jgi:hypothetical protein